MLFLLLFLARCYRFCYRSLRACTALSNLFHSLVVADTLALCFCHSLFHIDAAATAIAVTAAAANYAIFTAVSNS